MYAIIETGGKQYRVAPGDILRVERLPGTVGEEITLNKVLLVSAGEEFLVGRPWLLGAQVYAQILRQGRAKKILVFKKKRRKNYRRLRGHRQYYTSIRINEIQV